MQPSVFTQERGRETIFPAPPRAPRKPDVRAGPDAAICLALIAFYLLPGLIGHDPWKQHETYIADILRNMLDTGNALVPTMAGEPFMEKPPSTIGSRRPAHGCFQPCCRYTTARAWQMCCSWD